MFTLSLTDTRSAGLFDRDSTRSPAVPAIGAGHRQARTMPIEEVLDGVIKHLPSQPPSSLLYSPADGRSELFVDWNGKPLRRGGLRYLVGGWRAP